MQFDKKTPLYAYEVKRKSGEDVLYINFQSAPFVPSISDYPEVMQRVVELLSENPSVTRVVLVQDKNYNYDFEESKALMEVAQLYNYLVRQENVLSQRKLILNCDKFFSQRYNEVYSFLFLLKQDPLVAYFELKNALVQNKVFLNKVEDFCKSDQQNYVHILEKMMAGLSKLKIISRLKPFLENYVKGDREIYHRIFKPDVIPTFTFTRLVLDLPEDAEIVDQYKICPRDNKYDESLVTILRMKNESKFFYHLNPPENSLSEDHNYLLNLARNVLLEHQPKAEEYIDSEKIRQVFFNIARDLLRDLSESQGIKLDFNEINKLATILVRHTIGFGLIEVLLYDSNIQDIALNAPIPLNNIFLRHQEFEECYTNILPSSEDVDSWAAKFRMISGRPLDEANPILDTQLEIGNVSARIAIIQRPLSPDGLSYSIRRHREKPWTLPLFINNKMLNSFTAGLLSFLIDGSRTMLVAGTRSSGKTSLLGSLLLEIMSKYRIIVVEDTLELPVEAMRKLDYDILRMKVRSALLRTTSEVSADDGIRTSLRLGDSSLIVGEIRSEEAVALYEAMRVGALANVVAGTIHGASPYGVFDRVVNDLKVPATSFKATDIICVANPIKTPDGMHSMRRILELAEIRKHWKEDPMEEKGFVDLLKYNVESDELEPTEDLINGDSEIIKDIASNVKGWAGNWDAVYDNILLRGKIKQELVDVANKAGNLGLLEAEFTTLANHMFHSISAKVREEIGIPLSDRVFPEWQKWLNSEIKRRKI